MILGRPLKERAGASPPRVARRLPTVSVAEHLEGARGAGCQRSPCSPQKDPKAEERQIMAALKKVGSSKRKLRVTMSKKGISRRTLTNLSRPGAGKGWPLTVACGLGVDSIAILVGLVQEHKKRPRGGWRPEAITFADTGGEHPETYAMLAILNGYLKKNGFPPVTVVVWSTEMLPASYGTKASWGTGITLEINVLNAHTVPSISTGGHNCSDKFKIQPQGRWISRAFKDHFDAGLKVVRAIGYDATEEKRLISGGTYSASKEAENKKFEGWYPLIDWGWDRARCIAEIAVAFGSKSKPAWNLVPRKSSCFFCGAMKPEEILLLWESGHVDLLERALIMEQVAVLGRHPLRKIPGLGRSFAWSDFVTANLEALRPRQRVVITGGILYPSVDKNGKVSWRAVHEGHPDGYDEREASEAAFKKRADWRYYYPDNRFPLISKRRLGQIKKIACRWIETSPPLKSKGVLAHDLTFHPMADTFPAFEILGFRGTNVPAFDRLPDELIGRYEDRAASGDRRYSSAIAGLIHVHNRTVRRRWKAKRAKQNPRQEVTAGISLAGGLAVR